jgi:hypothetical protein
MSCLHHAARGLPLTVIGATTTFCACSFATSALLQCPQAHSHHVGAYAIVDARPGNPRTWAGGSSRGGAWRLGPRLKCEPMSILNY